MKRLTIVLVFCAFFFTTFAPVVTGDSTLTTGSTGTGFITVTNPPAADFYTSTRYGSAPFTVSFSDGTRGTTPTAWHWDFGDGTTSVAQNPTHTYKADGDYTVRLTVTNPYGTDTKTIPAYIGVGVPPEADFSAAPRNGTIPLTVTFTDISKARPTAWKWNFGDGNTSIEQNPVHTYAAPGIYFVTLRVSNHFGSDGLTKSGYISVTTPAPGVPAASNTTAAGKPKQEGLAGLISEAKGTTQKNLPTAGLIPPQFMALAAVLTSLAVIGIQFIIANIGFISQLLMKFTKFLADLIFGHAVEKLSAKEIETRKIAVRKMEQKYFGLSAGEVIVIELAVIVVALAFMLADRAELTLEMVLIYISVGAVSVVLHDFAHRFFATRHGQDADTQFWGLGTVIMFLTAWLYGNAFGSSYRNLVNRTDDEDPKAIGTEMVAGPVVSVILMIVFLWMVTLGDLWAVAGGVGFTINLITAVYSLMPIDTMDGLAIWRWNRGIYLALVVPLFLFYCYTFMMV